MKFYNAIVYPNGPQTYVPGVTHLKDISRLPLSVQVTFGGKEIYSTSHLRSILCYQKQPLILEKRDQKTSKNRKRPTMVVKVEFADVGMKIFPITLDTTVEELKQMISKATKVRPAQQIIYCYLGISGIQIELQDSETMKTCCVEDGCSLHLFEKSDGGVKEGFSDWWKSNRGLNVIGKCEDRSCPSYQQENLIESLKPIHDLDYGTFSFTDKSLLNCPACAKRKLRPINFFIQDARASVKYIRTQESSKKIVSVPLDTSTLLANDANRMQLWENNQELNYRCIQIKCVPLCQSPFQCCKCGLDIEMAKNEKTYPCGHVFDDRCFNKVKGIGPGCNVCQAVWFVEDAVNEIVHLNDSDKSKIKKNQCFKRAKHRSTKADDLMEVD